MRLLPPATIPGRVLTISVDLPRNLLATTKVGAEPVDCLVLRLSRVFESYNVPVTWGLDDPTSMVGLRSLLPKPNRHEIALRYEPGLERAERSREFQKLIVHARSLHQAGRRASSLLMHGGLPAADLERLACLGISLIADHTQLGARGGPLVETLRFGMWRLAASWRTSGRRRWLRDVLASARARRQIDRAIAHHKLFHIAVDGTTLAADRSAMRTLERVLRHADRRRHQGLLRVLTLAEVAGQLPLPRHGAAAHSILKAKAA